MSIISCTSPSPSGLIFPISQRDQRTQRVLVLAQRLPAEADHLATLRRRRRAPDLEGNLGALDDRFVIRYRNSRARPMTSLLLGLMASTTPASLVVDHSPLPR